MTENPYAGSPSEAPAAEDVDKVKPQVEQRAGWIPRRGHEAHGVMPTVETELPEDQVALDVPDVYKSPPLKEQEPLPVVPGWHQDVAKRIVSRARSLPISEDVWTRVLDENQRRIALSFWVTPSPTATDRIYFTTENPPPGDVSLSPYIVDGGQQIGLYQFEFTNDLFTQVVGTPPVGGYTIHVIEEYEVKA